MYVEKGLLRVGVFLAADAYYSLVPCFAAGHFKEVVLQVRNLRYTRGKVYRIELTRTKTPLEDM